MQKMVGRFIIIVIGTILFFMNISQEFYEVVFQIVNSIPIVNTLIKGLEIVLFSWWWESPFVEKIKPIVIVVVTGICLYLYDLICNEVKELKVGYYRKQVNKKSNSLRGKSKDEK